MHNNNRVLSRHISLNWMLWFHKLQNTTDSILTVLLSKQKQITRAQNDTAYKRHKYDNKTGSTKLDFTETKAYKTRVRYSSSTHSNNTTLLYKSRSPAWFDHRVLCIIIAPSNINATSALPCNTTVHCGTTSLLESNNYRILNTSFCPLPSCYNF